MKSAVASDASLTDAMAKMNPERATFSMMEYLHETPINKIKTYNDDEQQILDDLKSSGHKTDKFIQLNDVQ
jgi:hypothetical protein